MQAQYRSTLLHLGFKIAMPSLPRHYGRINRRSISKFKDSNLCHLLVRCALWRVPVLDIRSGTGDTTHYTPLGRAPPLYLTGIRYQDIDILPSHQNAWHRRRNRNIERERSSQCWSGGLREEEVEDCTFTIWLMFNLDQTVMALSQGNFVIKRDTQRNLLRLIG